MYVGLYERLVGLLGTEIRKGMEKSRETRVCKAGGCCKGFASSSTLVALVDCGKLPNEDLSSAS